MTTEVSTQNTPFFADIAELLTQARSNAYRTAVSYTHLTLPTTVLV